MRIKPVLQQCCKKSFIFYRCPFYLTLRYISFPGKWHFFKPFRAAYELWNSGFTNTSVNYLYECVYRCWRTRWPWLAAMDNECEKKRKTKKSYIVTYTFRDFCDIMVSNPNRLLHQMSPLVNRSWNKTNFVSNRTYLPWTRHQPIFMKCLRLIFMPSFVDNLFHLTLMKIPL